MKYFEINIATISTSTNNSAFKQDKGFQYWQPEEAEDAIHDILSKYGQVGFLYMNGLEQCLKVPHWGLVFLDKDYPIAEHIFKTRVNSNIIFSQYAIEPEHKPEKFKPKVGLIVIKNKSDLELAKDNSLLFGHIWNCLQYCDTSKYWTLLMDSFDAKMIDANTGS